MRTQNSTLSLRSIRTLHRTPYVCSSCRRNASRIASTEAAKSSLDSANHTHQPKFVAIAPARQGFVRQLHHSSERPGPADAPSSNSRGQDGITTSLCTKERDHTQDEQPVDDVALPGNASGPPVREDIRLRLRRWSEEQSRLAVVSGMETSSIGALPPNNSLLLEEAEAEDGKEPLEIHEDNLDAEDENSYALNALALEPGDVFRAKLKGVHTQFAIFLGLRQMKQADLLLADGRWASAMTGYPNTVILPGFAKPEETEFLRSCISEHPNFQSADASEETVLGDLPVALTEHFTRRLSRLSEETITFQRENTTRLDDLYTNFAHEDKFVSVGFSELVASKLGFDRKLEDLSMGARYAIFATFRKNEGRHVIVRTKSNLVNVLFTPKALYKQILNVTTWARQYQDCAARAALGHDVAAELRSNPLNTFINKARRIILKSRKIRSPTTIGSLGPSSSNIIREDGSVVTRETGETFSSEDHSVIEFLWSVFLRRPFVSQDVSAKSVGALILRAIGAYPKMQLSYPIAKLFFREMGLQAPWSEDMDNDLRIPAPGRRGALAAQTLIRQTDEMARIKGFTSDRFQIPLPDTMASLRKDWGPTEVYCIDKPSTGILDDGISLEDSADVPRATWVHVHVAHPSAFLHHQSDFALRARALTSAIYTSAKLYGMLPENMLHAMSLRPNASVMTVSSLMLENGEVGDVKVTVGTIRNIIRLDPAAVQGVLGTRVVEEAVLQVGPTIAKSKTFDMSDFQDASKHAGFIRKLDSIVNARSKMRRKEYPDYPRWKVLLPTLNDYVSWTEIFDGSRHNRSYHYLGDPTIRITSARNKVVRTWDKAWDEEMDLTGHTMILVGESIGRWLKERRIPAVYTGAVPTDKENSVALLNEKLSLDPTKDLYPRKLISSSPVAHVLLGVTQYVRMTSPLRRYSDNVAQWQIDAYLKAEAEGRLPASGDPRGLLPFTSEEIDEYIQEGGDTTTMLEMLKRKSTIHWNMQAIFRAFHFNEAPLPAIWDAQITQPNLKVPITSEHYHEAPEVADVVAYLQPFFLRTLILKSKEGWEVGVKRFQYLPVKIEYVDTTISNVYVRAVGPPSWTATQTGPVHCVKPKNEASAKGG